MKYVFAIIGLLVAAPYFLSDTGPHSIACSYDRIGRSSWSIITMSGRTEEEMARSNVAYPNCVSREGRHARQ
jgi:hypothetical protein